eukprot:gene12482-6230_t
MKFLKEKQDIEQFLNETENFFLDCDGVLWRGKEIIPGVKETLEFLRKKNKNLFFITNNSANTREEYQIKFKSKFGLDVSKDEIYTSGYCASVYLKHQLDFKKKIYVIGSSSLKKELKSLDLSVHEEDHTGASYNEEEMSKIKIDKDIECVLVGYESNLNNFKLAFAHQIFQQNENVRYIATNLDATLPYGNTFLPGTGSVMGFLNVVLKREPDYVCGKPNKELFNVIKTQFKNLDLEKSCMIGDRLDTDIKMGINAGISTLCVLTGVTQLKDLETNEVKPTYVLNSIVELNN